MEFSKTTLQQVASWETEAKVEAAIRRAIPLLDDEAKAVVQGLLSPESIAIVSATVAIWAGSHFFGIGQIVDIILLVTGFALLGLSVWDLARELWDFGRLAVNAQTERDLDRAAGHFARAVTLGGIDLIAVILLRRSARTVRARGRPQVTPGLIDVGPPPSSGGRLLYRPKISRPARLPRGVLGKTDPYGNIAVLRTQTLTEQQLTLYHEWVHSVLSPRLVPLQRLRASLRLTGYEKSALLRFVEEALAESYARLRVLGLAHAWKGVTFPIGPPGHAYVTVGQMVSEGSALGTIVLGGQLFRVHVVGAVPEPTGNGVR